MKFKDEKHKYEYEKLFAYEVELTKSRWTVFAALFSVSLIIPGLALRGGAADVQSLGDWAKYAIVFGFLVYLTALYHYWWHHRISHAIRDKLKKIEEIEGLEIIKVRGSMRPKCGPFKIYFHWAIWIMGLAYTFLTFRIVGVVFFLFFMGGLVLSFIVLAVIYKLLPAESKE